MTTSLFLILVTASLAAQSAVPRDQHDEVRYVGRINNLPIYDIFYRFHSEGAVDCKSIVVKTGPNQYREIYHREPTQIDARALPSTMRWRCYGRLFLPRQGYCSHRVSRRSRTALRRVIEVSAPCRRRL